MVQFNLGRVMNRSSISALHLDKFSTFFRLVYFFQEEITNLLSSQLSLVLSYRFTPEAQNRFLFIFVFFKLIAKALKRLKKNDTLLEPINHINREQIHFSSMCFYSNSCYTILMTDYEENKRQVQQGFQ